MSDLPEFQQAEPEVTEAQIASVAADPQLAAQLEEYLARIYRQDLLLFTNGIYTVAVDEVPATRDGWPPMYHFSIKRNDRQPIHDWRHLQQIKNMVLGTLFVRATMLAPEVGLTYEDGAECEAVELYPRESRLVDDANQYHLYALMHPRMGFPFGSMQRQTSTPDEAAAAGAVQRPFEGPLPTLTQMDRATRRRILRGG